MSDTYPVTYPSKESCLAAIETLKDYGLAPAPWILEQLEAFEASEKAIRESKTPIWDTLKTHYPFGVMPMEKIKCVEETVAKLMETGPHAEEPGLLLGKIQCGKTDTFEDIIGLAFDKGIDIAIVITKGTKALVNQTVMRLKKDFRFFKATDRLDQLVTVHIYDIMDGVWRNPKPAKFEGNKSIIVCKKNAANLEHLMEMFEQNASLLKPKKVLIVDDEADFASRNYKTIASEGLKTETEMARIAQQIDDFRRIPDFCRYLQVTATPYCLYLQPDSDLNLNGNTVKPFKPRFTTLVPVHDKYIGGKQYFVDSENSDSMYSHLFHRVEQVCMDVLGCEEKKFKRKNMANSAQQMLYGLTYALVAYFMATAIRRIQMAKTDRIDYKSSAIIHTDINKREHDWQRRTVNRLIEMIKDEVRNTTPNIWVGIAIDSAYDDFVKSNRKGQKEGLIGVNLPSKKEALAEVRKIFDTNNYQVQTVNSDEEVGSMLDEDTGELTLDTAANIFIGGNILDRGVTIKNILCFFYGRNPKTFQQDTVLQHARMYGTRSKEDMAVMRFHTTSRIYTTMKRMNDLDEQLRQWFLEGKDQDLPNAIFVGYDKEIRPCAPQKIKATDAITIKQQQRILPVGFWTGSKSEIGKTVEMIDNEIKRSANYKKQDKNGFFEIDKNTVIRILRLIEETYVYGVEYGNNDKRNDIKEMLCVLDYCTEQSHGKIFALHREDRNMNRIRENGCFSDAPDSGNTDTEPAHEKAQDAPVIMFFRQNGQKNKDKETGSDVGWNGTPFYWPVLMTQKNMQPVMFALD